MDEKILDARKEPNRIPGWIIIVIIVLAVAFLGTAAYAFYPQIKDKFFKSKSEPSTSATPEPSATASAIDKTVDEGVTWVKMEQLEDLGLFEKGTKTNDGEYELEGTDYYKVAQTSSGNDIILAEVKISAMGNFNELHRFIKKSDKYYRLNKNSDQVTRNGYDTKYEDDDATFILKSLLADKTITKGETELIQENELGPSETEGLSAAKKVADTKWGDLSLDPGQDVTNSNGQVKASRYFVSLNDGTHLVYAPKPIFLKDDGTFAITSSTTIGSFKYELIATSGCGSGGASFPNVVNETMIAGKTEFGASTKGSKVYSFTLIDDPANKFGYAVYTIDGADNKKTIQQYTDDFGILLWIDDYGSPVLYGNTDYKPAAECAKPVVYLYPTSSTEVSVWVGAKMTKTDPEYKNGWKATAEPNGTLTVAGKTYPYLFWEGLGRGEYPQVQSGTVVRRVEVEKTIKTQLAEIGLNQKETADFLEFWAPKMPSTPYVRLTWFQNDELNALAPMKISPRPDSVIRVFLDFQGLNEKTSIPVQTLKKYERIGFTAVEWGGLLTK